MIERVARAICHDRGYDPDELEPGDAYGVDGRNRQGEPCHFTWRRFAATARAAIEAMREPTTQMLGKGSEGIGGYDTHGDRMVAVEVWQAMIDAALQRAAK